MHILSGTPAGGVEISLRPDIRRRGGRVNSQIFKSLMVESTRDREFTKEMKHVKSIWLLRFLHPSEGRRSRGGSGCISRLEFL